MHRQRILFIPINTPHPTNNPLHPSSLKERIIPTHQLRKHLLRVLLANLLLHGGLVASEERIHQLLVVNAARRPRHAARLQQRPLQTPLQVARHLVLRLDGHGELQHFLPVFVAVEDTCLVGVVDEFVVDQRVERVDLVLGTVADAAETDHVAREEKRKTRLFRELKEETVRTVRGRGYRLERHVL